MQRRRFLRSLVAAPLSGAALSSALANGGPGPVQRRLRFTLTFTNPLDRPLEAQQFWCYLPADAGPAQRLAGLQVTAPHTVQADVLGHRILGLQFERFPALAQKVVTLTAQLELAPGAAPRHELAGPGAWLGAERYIESDAAEIRALAAQLRRETEIASARAIYEWVRDSIGYAGYLADDFGALHALRSRRGDCTEYADLVVALARANGIPARMAGGYVAERDAAPQPADYHNWAQLYLDGAWRNVDAQKQSWLAPPAGYILFRIYRDAPTNTVGQAHRYRMAGELKVAF